jgi:hypothetical protein
MTLDIGDDLNKVRSNGEACYAGVKGSYPFHQLCVQHVDESDELDVLSFPDGRNTITRCPVSLLFNGLMTSGVEGERNHPNAFLTR